MTIYFPQPLTSVHHNKNGPPLRRYNVLLLRIFLSDCRWIQNVIKHIIPSWQVDKCPEKPADLFKHSPLLWWCVHDFKDFLTICQTWNAVYEHQKHTWALYPCGHSGGNWWKYGSLFTEMKTYGPKNKHWSQSHCIPYCTYTMWRLINANITRNSLQPSQRECSPHDEVTTGSNWSRSQINNVSVNDNIYIELCSYASSLFEKSPLQLHVFSGGKKKEFDEVKF